MQSLLKLQTAHSSLLLLPIGSCLGGQDERDQHIAVTKECELQGGAVMVPLGCMQHIHGSIQTTSQRPHLQVLQKKVDSENVFS